MSKVTWLCHVSCHVFFALKRVKSNWKRGYNFWLIMICFNLIWCKFIFFQAAVKTLQYITNKSKQFDWNSPVARVGIIDAVRTMNSAQMHILTVVLPLSASLLSLYCWCYKYLNENSYPKTKPKQCPKPENYKPNNISRRVNNQNPKPQSHSSCENKSGNSWSVDPWL